MNVAIGLEFRSSWSMFSETPGSRSAEANKKTSNPLSAGFVGTDTNILSKFEPSIQSGQISCDAAEASRNEDMEQNPNNEFTEFRSRFSTLGKNENYSINSDMLPAAPCALTSTISEAGQFTFSAMARSVNEACTALASFFGPNANQVTRVVFSALSLASTMTRAVFPLVKDALSSVSDPGIKLALTLASFSLSAIHVLFSAVATAIATNNVPALFSRNSEAADFKNKMEGVKNALHAALDKFAAKLAEINRKGLVGWLGVVREWLLTSAAVVGFISVLPLLVKTVGTIISAPVAAIVGGSINLIAAIVELVQGSQEYRLLSEELQKLKIKEGGILTPAEKLQLEADIRAKTGALLASKIRIGKGVVGILTSVASIVLGTLTLAVSIAVPYLPAVLTTISLLGVVVYASVAIALRKMREQEDSALNSAKASVPDTIDSLIGDTSINTGSMLNTPAGLVDVDTSDKPAHIVPVPFLSPTWQAWQWRR